MSYSSIEKKSPLECSVKVGFRKKTRQELLNIKLVHSERIMWFVCMGCVLLSGTV